MRVSIWDVDYYNNHRGFNTDCMKISSFHKQRGDVVNFIVKEGDSRYPYDIMYITKEDDTLKNPPAKFFDCRAKIWGRGFRYLKNWEITDTMLSCRPDYLLYEERNNVFDRADMVQFFNNKGKKLPLLQDWHNAFTNKKTLVIDKAFWMASKKDIIEALDALMVEENISFLEPIWLSKIIYDKDVRTKFLQLNWRANSKFKFLNDIGDDVGSAKIIATFIQELKEHTISHTGCVYFDACTTNHFKDREGAWKDLERCLHIIDIGKAAGVLFKVRPLKDRGETPYYSIFETLIRWMDVAPELSLLEFIALKTCKKYGCRVEDVYANQLYWQDPQMYELMEIIARRPQWIRAYCLRRWKDRFLNITRIDWRNLEENT